ncbi:MAG: EamA family transporter [Gemmatimonas sp.]|nr:EamA family transporter [Gemmatimonas sp.]
MGEFYALLCAVIWAVAVILLKRSGETVSPFALNLFRVGISSVLLVATVLASGQGLVRDAPLRDVLILMASGIIAIAVADTLFHRCLNIVGAGVTAIVDCLYSPLVVLFAFLLIDERLNAWQLAGMVTVIAAVMIASGHPAPPGVPPRTLFKGALMGMAAMAAVALGVVVAKPVLERQPVLWSTTVRQLGALAVMLPAALVSPQRRRYLATFRPDASWRFSLPATILGSYLALMFWLAGMKYTQAGAAAILNQTSTSTCWSWPRSSFTNRSPGASWRPRRWRSPGS